MVIILIWLAVFSVGGFAFLYSFISKVENDLIERNRLLAQIARHLGGRVVETDILLNSLDSYEIFLGPKEFSVDNKIKALAEHLDIDLVEQEGNRKLEVKDKMTWGDFKEFKASFMDGFQTTTEKEKKPYTSNLKLKKYKHGTN